MGQKYGKTCAQAGNGEGTDCLVWTARSSASQVAINWVLCQAEITEAEESGKISDGLF